MPGGFVNWQEERQGLFIRLMNVPLLLCMAVFGWFEISSEFMYMAFVVIGVQSLLTLVGIPRRWAWLPSFNFYGNRIVMALMMGASGGAQGPFIVVPYVALVSVLIYFNTQRAVLILLSSHIVGIFAGSWFALFMGSLPTWHYALVHSVSLAMVAFTLARPLSQLTNRATTDPLTQAYNRRGGLEELESWVAHSQRFSLIFIDLKQFKRINDTYGHAVGDEVLTWLVQVCRTNIRDSDLVIRYGGDEFVLAVRNKTEPLIERLEGLLSAGLQTSAGHLKIQANVGVVRFPDDGRDLEQLLKLADEKMYEHKGGALIGA